MKQVNKTSTKFAIISISFMLMSAPAINGILPAIEQQLVLTKSQAEILSTLPNLFVILAILFSNLIADRIGMKKTVSLGLLLVGVGGSLPLLFSGYFSLICSRLILGAGLGLFNSLAISFISIFYKGNTRASLLGYRNAVESIGQAVLTLFAGLLLPFGWRISFAIYVLAFPLIFFFNRYVPETRETSSSVNEKRKRVSKEKIEPQMSLIFIFAIFLMLSNSAMIIRFPSLAIAIAGENYNASNALAVMPLFGILAGVLFGTIQRLLGSKTIYLNLLLLFLVNGLVSFFSDHFVVLVLALFLSGIPVAWMVSYLFNHIGAISKTDSSLNVSTSLLVICFNFGGLITPFTMTLIQIVFRSQALTAPFPLFATIYAVLFIALFLRKNQAKR